MWPTIYNTGCEKNKDADIVLRFFLRRKTIVTDCRIVRSVRWIEENAISGSDIVHAG